MAKLIFRVVALAGGVVAARVAGGRRGGRLARRARPEAPSPPRAVSETAVTSRSPLPQEHTLVARGLLPRAAVIAAALALVASVIALEKRPGKSDPRSQIVAAALPASDLPLDPEAARSSPEPANSRLHRLARAPASAAEEAKLPRVSPGAPSDAEVKRELEQLERYYGGGTRRGAGGVMLMSGEARSPPNAPYEVAAAISGGNAIARFPYRLGGGHGSFVDAAYDCSGSVSYALAAGGLLDSPLASGELARWGKPGPGRWITVYANPGHVFMEVGGLRFDTSGRAGRRGSRWQLGQRSGSGFVARHWPGL